ncbi:MAG: ClpXP protease specificity-enhancing factor [Rudaea sp.]|nr:ClpXP protease specificity-enhancing factor [Rudaea sp.]MBR0343782.1 ClpXP protease specificity-enhancing factor [Rudaea sp.]
MTSNRPYLLRAMYEWIADNGMTPYILVDANAPGVKVPKSAIKDGRVVLNVAARAVAQLELGTDRVRFMARFAGVSQVVEAPIGAVLAIYAQENGQGMMFPAENAPPAPAQPTLAAVEDTETPVAPTTEPPAPKKGPHLRVVK